MSLINLTTFADVNKLCSLVGRQGLRNYLVNCTNDHRGLIKDAITAANQTTFDHDSFNDGNNIFDVTISIDLENILNSVYYDTRHIPMTLEDMAKSQSIWEYQINILTSYFTLVSDNRFKLNKLVNLEF